MVEVLFDNISRLLELRLQTLDGEGQRGRLNLTRIYSPDGDFILCGRGANDGREHNFPLSSVLEIVDVESGEHVDIAEFRSELMGHPKI
ncbi:MAG: hypothetical protein EXR08_08060 [Alphaproteobacteria bacterium]|nr:hypothetical protein [Alphaproteobacteria bacterium]